MKTTEQYTFQLSDKATRQKVIYENRYGIFIAADLLVITKWNWATNMVFTPNFEDPKYSMLLLIN